jgi:hypothetical protein
MLRQGWGSPGVYDEVEDAVRKWGVPSVELTSLYKDFVLSRMRQSSWTESIVDQCTSLQRALGLTAQQVGNVHCDAVEDVEYLVSSDQITADGVERFLYLADRIMAAQPGTFVENSQRYERTQLAKVLKMNELVLRAKIQRIALPMYQAAVDRLKAGENVDLAFERQRLGVEDDSIMEVQIELSPKLPKMSKVEFKDGMNAALIKLKMSKDLRDVEVGTIEREEAPEGMDAGSSKVRVNYYVETKKGSRNVVETAIKRLPGTPVALERFNNAIEEKGRFLTLSKGEKMFREFGASSISVAGWRSIHKAAFEAAQDEVAQIQNASFEAALDEAAEAEPEPEIAIQFEDLLSAMDVDEEGRGELEFEREFRAAIADCVMDGTSLKETASRLGLSTEAAGEILRSSVAKPFSTWCAELESVPKEDYDTETERAAVTLFVRRTLSAGRLLMAFGVPANGTFEPPEGRRGIIGRRILDFAEGGEITADDLEVVQWLAKDKDNLAFMYRPITTVVIQYVNAVLENVKEVSSLDEYIRKWSYPAELVGPIVLDKYDKMVSARMRPDDVTDEPAPAPTDAEFADFAEKATALKLSQSDIQSVHDRDFGPLYIKAWREAMFGETDAPQPDVDAMRVQFGLSPRGAEKCIMQALKIELKPAVEGVYDGFKKWKGEDKKDEDKKKAEFPGGVSAAVDEILSKSKKCAIDVDLSELGLIKMGSEKDVYTYIVSYYFDQDYTKALEFGPLTGLGEMGRNKVHEEVVRVLLSNKVTEAMKSDQPCTSELTAGIWERLGCDIAWVEEYLTTQKSLQFIAKVNKMEINGFTARDMVKYRAEAEMLGVTWASVSPLFKRKRYFRIEARDALERQLDLDVLENAKDEYGLTAMEANIEVDNAAAEKDTADGITAQMDVESELV